MMRQDMARLWPWVKQLTRYRFRCLLGILLALATAAFGIGLLSLSGWFITATALYVSLNIYSPGAGIRFFAIGRTVSRYLERLVNHDIVLTLQARWRVALFRYRYQQPLASVFDTRVADTVQRLTRNLDAMDNVLLRLIMPLLVFVILSLLLAIFWVIWHPQLVLLLVIAAVLVLALTVILAVGLRPAAVKQLREYQRVRRQAMSVTEAHRELEAWSSFENQSQSLLQRCRKLERLALRQQQLSHWTVGAVEVVAQCLLIGVIVSTFYGYQQGLLTSAQVIMLTLSALAWQELAIELPNQWGGYGQTLAASRQLLSGSSEPSEEAQVPTSSGALRLKRVGIQRQHRWLIRKLNVELSPGKLHWLQGQSGLGKSSLADVIMGLSEPREGSVERPRGMSPQGYLTQQTELLDGSIKDNLNPSRTAIDEAEYWQVLELVELADVVRRMSKQLNTLIGSQGVVLSGGQARRLALARVLLSKPPVVLLDEPFAGLDYPLAARIAERMLQRQPQAIWIVISHIAPQTLSKKLLLPVNPIKIS